MLICSHMIYIIVGPTGSGKTEVAKQLSDYFSAPIINADAFQIYKEMDIGTAKIDKSDPYYKKHYLLDIKEPSESFSVMEYQKLFRETVDELSKKYENIIVCGGTGLYIRASIYDYIFQEEDVVEDESLNDISNEELYSLLRKLDYDASLNIHPNNRKRVIRAITIAKNQKETKSENIAKQKHELIYDGVKILMLSPKREDLYENINKRVDKMFELGLVDEVKKLLNKYQLSNTAKAAIGYKEVIDYLNNQTTLDECVELIKKRSRNYAKRQVTFFKNQFELEMFTSKEDLLKEVRGK